MKSIQDICDDLKGLDGSVGAFVWNDGNCLGSSLPKAYDAARLTQTGSELSRLSQLAQKASYEQCACVFHWQRATLFTWALNDNGVLALLALPTAPRGVLELNVSIAVEELLPLLGKATASAKPPPALIAEQRASAVITSAPANVTSAANATSAASATSTTEETAKLRELEELVIWELGPTGRVLFLRARQKAYRAGLSESTWLPALRTAVLADLGDPSAWASVAASVMWLPNAS